MNEEEVKKIRVKLGFTQKEFAEKLGVHYRTVQKWESGETKIKPSMTLMIKNVFPQSENNVFDSGAKTNNIPKDKKESKLLDVRIKNFDDEAEEFYNKNGIKFIIYPDNSTTIEVLKVPFKAYASYVEAFNDEEKLNQEFSKTQFKVDKVAKGNYLAFDVENDSMWNEGGYDTPNGAEVLARELGRHLWNDGFHDNKYGFILLTKKAIYHKDIKQYNRENGMLTLSSRNPDCKDFEISINDVYQIFKVIKRTF